MGNGVRQLLGQPRGRRAVSNSRLLRRVRATTRLLRAGQRPHVVESTSVQGDGAKHPPVSARRLQRAGGGRLQLLLVPHVPEPSTGRLGVLCGQRYEVAVGLN